MELSEGRRRLLGRLRRRRTRTREGLVLVEGVRAVGEALAAGAVPRFAVTAPRLDQVPGGPALADELVAAVPEVVEVPDQVLDGLADTRHPQGVLVVFEEPGDGLDALRGDGTTLVADAIQDPGNLGTLVRSAVAFGVDGVVALGGTVDPWGPKAVRASAGTCFRIPVVSADVEGFLAWTRRHGVRVLAAEAGGADVARVDGAPPWALVVGNEGSGPRPEILEAAHVRVSVPMPGPAESLNAGVAGTVLLYALLREDPAC